MKKKCAACGAENEIKEKPEPRNKVEAGQVLFYCKVCGMQNLRNGTARKPNRGKAAERPQKAAERPLKAAEKPPEAAQEPQKAASQPPEIPAIKEKTEDGKLIPWF
jgi:hypothetical protein